MVHRVPIPFHQRFVSQILAREKTVTRRPTPRHVGTLLRAKIPNGRKRPSEWPGFANLLVTDCRSVLLGAIDDAEARLEGFASAEEFKEFWGTNIRSWDPALPVWRIEFKVVKVGKEWKG